MKKLLTLLIVFLLSVVAVSAQTIGKTQTEQYKADFEKKTRHKCLHGLRRSSNSNSNIKGWNF